MAPFVLKDATMTKAIAQKKDESKFTQIESEKNLYKSHALSRIIPRITKARASILLSNVHAAFVESECEPFFAQQFGPKNSRNL
jgi:hypothetical protein